MLKSLVSEIDLSVLKPSTTTIATPNNSTSHANSDMTNLAESVQLQHVAIANGHSNEFQTTPNPTTTQVLNETQVYTGTTTPSLQGIGSPFSNELPSPSMVALGSNVDMGGYQTSLGTFDAVSGVSFNVNLSPNTSSPREHCRDIETEILIDHESSVSNFNYKNENTNFDFISNIDAPMPRPWAGGFRQFQQVNHDQNVNYGDWRSSQNDINMNSNGISNINVNTINSCPNKYFSYQNENSETTTPARVSGDVVPQHCYLTNNNSMNNNETFRTSTIFDTNANLDNGNMNHVNNINNVGKNVCQSSFTTGNQGVDPNFMQIPNFGASTFGASEVCTTTATRTASNPNSSTVANFESIGCDPLLSGNNWTRHNNGNHLNNFNGFNSFNCANHQTPGTFHFPC